MSRLCHPVQVMSVSVIIVLRSIIVYSAIVSINSLLTVCVILYILLYRERLRGGVKLLTST